MKYFFTSFLLFLSVVCIAQLPLDKLVKKSQLAYSYKISAVEAEQFIKWDSIPLQQFEKAPVFHVFVADSIMTAVLPVGHYVLVRIVDNEVQAWLENISNLVAYPAKNSHQLQLEVRNKEGSFIRDAEVYVAGKKASYHPASLSYWARQKQVKEAMVKVYTPGDTLFIEIEEDEDGYYQPVWKQRWRNLKLTRVGRVAFWLPNKIAALFDKRHRYRYRKYKTEGFGYVLFNQPKYKLTDTVKLKAYLLNKQQKQLRENLDVYLDYSGRGKSNEQLLAKLPAASPGAYVYSFPLSDTLVSDIRYSIVFKNKKGKTILSKPFSVEDYLLDDIGSYKWRAGAERYYRGDSLSFFASAKDANGNNLLDGKVRLLLINPVVKAYFQDTIYVADTLYNQEKDMSTSGETVFTLPASLLPNANMGLTAKAIFKNSNNELHEDETKIDYLPNVSALEVEEKQDSIVAVYRANGKQTIFLNKFFPAWSDKLVKNFFFKNGKLVK